MGYAKRMWEEEMARGYHTSEDAVCKRCFEDKGIRAFIAAHLTEHECSICGRKSQKAIAAKADEVLEFFLAKLHEHYQNADGNAPFDKEEWRYYVQTWEMSELIFDELCDIAPYDTLEWLNKHLKDDVTYCKQDWQVMSYGEALTSAWKRFCNAVKHETRFLFFKKEQDDGSEPFNVRPTEMLDQLGMVIRRCGLIRTIEAGTRFYRARGHAIGPGFTAAVDLGPPPQEHAKTAGRMNAPGIVVMYASLEKSAALVEATGGHPAFTIAEFELLKAIQVVDLTHIPVPPSIFEKGPRESLQFLHDFARAVTQPFSPDSEVHVEYTPTQVVSEFIRHRLASTKGKPIKGLLYGSAKEDGSTNIALFISSEEVEGVTMKEWLKKKALVRLVPIAEVMPAPSAA